MACDQTALDDKLLKSELTQQNTSTSLVSNLTIAGVKCPHRRKVEYLTRLWMVYMQFCQLFQKSNVIYRNLKPIKYSPNGQVGLTHRWYMTYKSIGKISTILTHSDRLFSVLKIYLLLENHRRLTRASSPYKRCGCKG